MNYYIDVLKKYAVFKGRATRKEYWMFVLYNFIIGFVLGFIDGFINKGAVGSTNIISGLYSLAILIPSIAVGVRRMHDVNKNGWFIIIPVYNLILACTGGTKGDNKYGADPKGVTAVS